MSCSSSIRHAWCHSVFFSFGIVITSYLLLSACVMAPSMTEATGGIPVREIVLRVKCELASAFVSQDDRTWVLDQPKFKWLKNWTAQADLTLQVLDTATLSPGATFTQAGKVVSGVQQSFALTAGATLNGQAQRTETISFAVSLQELESWRSRPGIKDACLPSDGMDLTGRLGLREWILEALSPVARENENLPEYLWAGYHPKPGNSPQSGTASPKSPGPPPAAALTFPCGTPAQALANGRQYLQSARTILNSASEAMSATSALIDGETKKEKSLSQNFAKVKKSLATFKSKNANFSAVMDPSIKESEVELSKAIKSSQPLVSAAEKDLKDAADAKAVFVKAQQDAEKTFSQAQRELDSDSSDKCQASAVAKAALDGANAAAAAAKRVNEIADSVTENLGHLADLSTFASRVVASFVSVDPPISAIGQSVQFTLAYGGNITPTWTFVQFKGPNGTLFTAQGTRTHILNITLGPALAAGSSAPSLSVTNNQLYLLLNNLLPPVVR
jgi:hypothetical protein